MSRRYKRDAKGRFASANAAGKAPKQIGFLRTYHGTSAEAAQGIRAGGYRESRGGALMEGVYTTRSRSIANKYAAKQRSPAVLAHRIPKGKVVKSSSFNRLLDAKKAGKAAYEVTPWQDTVLLNKNLADRTLVKPNSTVRRRRSRR